MERILPKYTNQAIDVSMLSAAEYSFDIQKIFAALRTASLEQREKLIDRLNDTPKAMNATRDKICFMRPDSFYMRNTNLELYFGSNCNVWFIEDSCSGLEGVDWTIFAIAREPRFIQVNGTLTWEEKQELIHRQHAVYTGRDEEVIDYDLDGLTQFLANLQRSSDQDKQARALALWNFLLTYAANRSLTDFSHGQYQWFYYTRRQACFDAKWVKRLRDASWLPSRNGALYKPGEISLAELPQEFKWNDALADILSMRHSQQVTMYTLAQEIGLDPKHIEFVKNHPDAIERLIEQEYNKRHDVQPAIEDVPEQLNYAEELAKVFSRPQIRETSDLPVPAAAVANPALRRERTQEEIAMARSDDPEPAQRFTRVPHKVWEASNNNVRPFLL